MAGMETVENIKDPTLTRRLTERKFCRKSVSFFVQITEKGRSRETEVVKIGGLGLLFVVNF
jgi:hypothetical protein